VLLHQNDADVADGLRRGRRRKTMKKRKRKMMLQRRKVLRRRPVLPILKVDLSRV
jgi:hypothetical protein